MPVIVLISQAEIDALAAYETLRAAGQPKHLRGTLAYIGRFAEYDTFLYGEFSARLFIVDGRSISLGEEINYIAFGALAGSYGHSAMTMHSYVTLWNKGQLFLGKGIANILNLEQTSAWAEYGRSSIGR